MRTLTAGTRRSAQDALRELASDATEAYLESERPRVRLSASEVCYSEENARAMDARPGLCAVPRRFERAYVAIEVLDRDVGIDPGQLPRRWGASPRSRGTGLFSVPCVLDAQ